MPAATGILIQGNEFHNTLPVHVVYRLRHSSDNTVDQMIATFNVANNVA